ncbi:MAG: VWA domain-containing protein [Acidobacteria bacterium]|nr:VWA domain-containing protein [Acidobacteriota bacterium]
MRKRRFLSLLIFAVGITWAGAPMAQEKEESPEAVFRVEVDMVLLNVAVTDGKGNYVTGLRPWDFEIYEDGIPQKIAIFSEGSDAPRPLEEFVREASNSRVVRPLAVRPSTQLRNGAPAFSQKSPDQVAALTAGANVFILFDTSNYMYEGFVFAQDAIAEFIRSLDNPDRVALYSYSRDLSRVVPITADRLQVLRGLRRTVAGDNAALYNALLITLRDAARLSGRKMVVAFSNGPDNASMVAPENVRELAQAEGIPIYMISTREAKRDPVSTAVFERISTSTGGKVYFARTWKQQQEAFTAIREDLAHLYALSYYPQTNSNRGWREITVKLAGNQLRKYQVRTRTGYRPRTGRLTGQLLSPSPER